MYPTDESLELAVKLSERYITSRFLPDKAIDILDGLVHVLELILKRPLILIQ